MQHLSKPTIMYENLMQYAITLRFHILPYVLYKIIFHIKNVCYITKRLPNCNRSAFAVMRGKIPLIDNSPFNICARQN